MSEAILTFQAQLSGVMETVLKTAVFEITWLVESSFQQEVARGRREAEALRQRLQAAERRWRAAEGRATEGRVTCEKCGRVSAGGSEHRAGAPPDGAEKGCGVKEEEEVGRTLSSCVMDTPDEAARTFSRPPETPTCLDRDRLDPARKEEGGPRLQEGLKVTVESSGHVYYEDMVSKDSAELLEEQGCKGDSEGCTEEPKLTGLAPEYTAYDRAAVIGRGESGGDLRGRGLSPTATGGEEIQIENVISLSRPQLCLANHVRRKLSRKARDVVAKPPPPQQQQLELPPACQSASAARSGASGPHAAALSFPAPRDLRPLPGVAAGDKQISCVYCGKSFSYVSRLKIHLLKHTGEKPFSCSQCGKRFTIARNLERHQHIHWGDAAFCCSHCGKRFKRADHLKVHQRVHTGERPYSCPQCSKRFRFSGDLNTHKRVHTGEKPYCCTLCGNRFGQLRQLKAHQRSHKGLGRFDPLIK
ncbi:zinc finger protein 397-like [Anguilla anguilla]|uniref:zinc finger protein 397-like n=1 Tax=Anguilla anguilla TaxID=7936 RepID=UPI0015AA602E|nr:zinc finger protein 397-like [Anguilla anguilla]XP_035281522.1 zinc finger protein 397-like [Anguilla anguilla]